MPKTTGLEISPGGASPDAGLRCGARGTAPFWPCIILLLCAVGRHPTEIADVLFCSRSRCTALCEPIG